MFINILITIIKLKLILRGEQIIIKKTVCFTGHRNIPPSLYPQISKSLAATLVTLIKNGYIYFGTGGALGFDTLAALTVLRLKKYYPEIKLILVLPCLSQTNGWSSKDITIYENIKKKADKVVYTSREYYSGCMLKRNRHLVDCSSVCVCYLTKNSGGTAYTVNYARAEGLNVINVANAE